MQSTYHDAMTKGVFPHEGGYSNHPSDPGGPTNWGITIIDARKYWKPNATAADVRAMPKAVAEDIYAKHYAAPLRYDDLPPGVDYCVLDYGINSGISRAGKVLRRVLRLSDSDWTVTDGVLAAVAKQRPSILINAICDERLRFLKSLKTWPVFGDGWGRRVSEVRALALSFARAAETAPVVVSRPAPGKASAPQVPSKPAARNATTGGTLIAAILAALSANKAEVALAVIVVGIIVAVIIHKLWPKKEG